MVCVNAAAIPSTDNSTQDSITEVLEKLGSLSMIRDSVSKVDARPILATALILFLCLNSSNTFLRAQNAVEETLSPRGLSEAAADHAVVEALIRLPGNTLTQHPDQREAVQRYLSRNVGTPEYISVAQQLGVYDSSELVDMLSSVPFNTLSVEAAKLLVRAKDFDSITAATTQDNMERAAAATTALGFVGHPKVATTLQSIFEDENAIRQIRIAAAGALGRNDGGQKYLLEKAMAGKIGSDVRFIVTDSLLGSSNEAIRKEASKHVAAASSAKSEQIPPVKQLAKMRGNATQGKVVFHNVGTCIKCHKVKGEGKEVGPDLSEIGSKLSREDMYVAILNPSAAISHNYETYTVLDVDGRVTTGLLMNETDSAVTIRDAEGIDHQIAAGDVETLKKQSVSLMPADLQKAMTLQDLNDLVDYLVLLKKDGEQPFNAVVGSGMADEKHDPTKAIAGFEIADDVEVELFAYEPQLLSPTSIDVDSKGRVWVCEAVNYRHFRNGQNKPRDQGDRILVLEDTDGDGRCDKETVFYQSKEIDSPHGVCVIGKQVIVSAGENVIVFTDEDDDLKPESKKFLFTGISGVQHDHGIHAFRVGPDGKLYFNFGNEGKQLKGPAGETVVDKAGNVVDSSRNPYQQGMVFRCNPDGSELETLGWNFRNNWELCVDSFGTMWQSDNDDDGNRGTRINYVMEYGNYGYRDELTGATWRAKRTGLEDEVPLQHWHLNDPGVMPNILQTGAGSPTGICFYEGDLLPEPFQNQIIHTDPGPNVVRAYPVEDDGAGYKASIRNLIKGVQDPWFRPVDVCVAPDGSLLIADWYDPGVGGHRMGDIKHGRIFRVVPKGHKGYSTPKFDFATAKGAIEALQSPNLATRYLAQQALAKLGPSAVAALEQLVESTGSNRIKARALWQLGLIGNAPSKYVRIALESDDADLRVMGIRFARQHELDLLSIVDELMNDSSPKVLRELAIALRHNESARAADLWAELATRHGGEDRWYLEALGIAADGQWDQFFDAWLTKVGDQWDTPGGRDIVWRCRSSKACKYLAKIIQNTQSVEQQYRYFRAFDFHEGESKVDALTDLISVN